MNCYVVSPSAGGPDTESQFLISIRNEQIVIMGWDTTNRLGQMFADMRVGDLVIIAKGQNISKKVYFSGYVSSETIYDKTLKKYKRSLSNFCDIQSLDVPFGNKCSYMESQGRGIPAIYRLKEENPADMKVIDIVTKYMAYNIIQTQLSALLTANHQIILTGAPGTGKTHLAREVAAKMIGLDNVGDLKNHPNRFNFVQFHPAYDYTDFVEGLKPVNDGKEESGKISFRVQDGIFMRFCKEARKQGTKPCVFVIDEINRADLSRVFGELFYALEPGYRGENGAISTQYVLGRNESDRELFYVPKNVFIIGTMNDVDRSVESIDFALRRRFAWYEIKADEARFDAVVQPDLAIKEEAKNRYTSLKDQIKIVDGLGPSYQIGPAYFRKLAEYSQGNDENGSIWDKFWDRHLKLLLREYLRGRSDEKEQLQKFRNAYDLQPDADVNREDV